MGDFSDAILDGIFCEVCGAYIDDDNEECAPSYCDLCEQEEEEP